MINADVNIKNWLTKEYVIKDLFGILAINLDKSCDVGGYLDYENCKFRKMLIDKLFEKCSENIDENEMIYNHYRNVCNYCTVYIVLFVIAVLIIICISSVFVCFHWYLTKSSTGVININPDTETIIY